MPLDNKGNEFGKPTLILHEAMPIVKSFPVVKTMIPHIKSKQNLCENPEIIVTSLAY